MKELVLIYGDIKLPKPFEIQNEDKEVLHLTDRESNYKHVLKKSSASHIPDLKEKVKTALILIQNRWDIKNLEKIFEKTQIDNTRTVLLLDVKNENLINTIPKKFLLGNTTLVVKGEEFDRISQSEISKIFQKAIGIQKFELSYEKVQPIAIISQNDSEEALSHLLKVKGEKIVLFFYENPITLQTAAIEFVKIFPEIEISYTNRRQSIAEADHKKIIKKLTTHFEKKPNYTTVKNGFKKEVASFDIHKGESRTKKKGTTQIRTLHSILKVSLVSLGIFLLSSALISLLGLYQLHSAKESINSADITATKKSLSHAKKVLSLTSPFLSFITYTLPVDTDIKQLVRNHSSTLDLALKTLSDIESAIMYQNVQNSQQAIAQLTHAFFTFSRIEQNQNVLGEKSSKMASILQGFSSIAGKEATYLLLFQNNAELRPTGGFIGSVGELKIKDGKIEDITIQDVYQIDGQLTERIEPHFIVRKHLQPHMYLRDSNFDIEFSESAQNAARIYNSVTGRKVDGVIALDFEVVKRLLANTGEISLPEHNLTLDAQQAQSIIQDSIQENFFPGSTKKKDVLQSLLARLLLQIEQNPKNAAAFAKEIPDLLEQKHILFAFQNNSIQKLFTANGYTGEITDTRRDTENAVNDIFGVTEANIGVNKANESITRRLEYQAFIGTQSIVSKANVFFFNTGNNTEEYKVYLRFIVPKGSEIESILIDKKEQTIVPAITDAQIYETRTYNPPIGLEVDQKEYDEYKTIGFVTTVQKRRTQEVSIIYRHEKSNELPNKYSLLHIKQPGTTEYPLHITIEYNQELPANSSLLNIQDGKATLKDVVSTDKKYEINFTSP